jgi:hypothetical protein
VTPPPASVEYEPALVEAAVLLAAGPDDRHPELRAGRDACYAVADPEFRDLAFRALFARWFERLGLGAPLAAALREAPAVAEGVGRCVVAATAPGGPEGGELSPVPRAGEGPVALLRVRPRTLGDPAEALACFRRELLHLADLLDPAFGYDPASLRESRGSLRAALLRERYRVLWAVSVAARLARRGWLPDGELAERRAEFSVAFPMLGLAAEDAFARLLAGGARTHAELLALAREPARLLGSLGRGPAPGERCPACGGPTHAFVPDSAGLPTAVLARLRADIPGWTPADGVCRQCADLYAARGVAPATSEGPGGRP